MLMMSCADVRRDLSAFHDEELSIGERIAISDHLENCPSCSVEADDLLAMRESLQAANHAELVACGPMLSRVQSDVIERLAAEESVSFSTWLRELLEDRQRAFATCGAALAACGLVILGVLQLGIGRKAQPDSLAALLEREEQVWAARSERPVLLPRVNPETIMPAAVVNQTDGDESSSAFAFMVTEHGNLAQLQFLDEQPVDKSTGSQKQLELAAAATASFQPASKGGAPVPLNVVWLVTHRTVRATMQRARIEITSTFRIG
jgi:hypothetical protein